MTFKLLKVNHGLKAVVAKNLKVFFFNLRLKFSDIFISDSNVHHLNIPSL